VVESVHTRGPKPILKFSYCSVKQQRGFFSRFIEQQRGCSGCASSGQNRRFSKSWIWRTKPIGRPKQFVFNSRSILNTTAVKRAFLNDTTVKRAFLSTTAKRAFRRDPTFNRNAAVRSVFNIRRK
jgi:hypothetical protein